MVKGFPVKDGNYLSPEIRTAAVLSRPRLGSAAVKLEQLLLKETNG
jgi:hypothetical protein